MKKETHIKTIDNITDNISLNKSKFRRVKSTRGLPLKKEMIIQKSQISTLTANNQKSINNLKSKDSSINLKTDHKKINQLNISINQNYKQKKSNDKNIYKTFRKIKKPNILENMILDITNKIQTNRNEKQNDIKQSTKTNTESKSKKKLNHNNNNNNIINNNNINNNNGCNNSIKNNNIKVFVRFRPLNEFESILLNRDSGWCVPEYMNSTTIGIYTNKDSLTNKYSIEKKNIFKYDKIFDSNSTQIDLYTNVGKRIANDILEGYNGTIFAYGQSGSGKTYTMYGPDIYDNEQKGIIPRIVEEIFAYIENSDNNVDFLFKLSVLEIYKEILYDLLTQEKDLKIQENPQSGIYVDGLSEIYLSSLNEFFDYVNLSQANRKVTETKMNHNSSRSHCILILEITQSFKKEKIIKKGILNLVDLAGSEKVSKTGAIGETLEEAKKINLSLSTLGNVIHALTHKSDHIPYRDSKLTRLLKESLGGNYKTSLIVTCSPHSYNLDETISSLFFAKRVKTIKNNFKKNIKYSYEELQKMINYLNEQLIIANNRLKNNINNSNSNCNCNCNNIIDVKYINNDNSSKDQISDDFKLKNKHKDSSNNEFISSIFECSNCILLKKDKQLLEDKIQKLLDKIQDKDNEINRLKNINENYNSNNNCNNNNNFYHCSRYVTDSAQKSFAIASSGDNNLIISIKDFHKNENQKQSNNNNNNKEIINLIDTTTNNSLFKDEKKDQLFDLYEKIKDKLKKIEEENSRINIIQNEEAELRKIQLKIDQVQNIIKDFQKSKDKINAFLKMDNFTKISIPFVKKKEYQKEFELYKENLFSIFENTFNQGKNPNLSDKEYLNLLSTDFFFEYLRFYFCHQIMSQGYEKLTLDNNSLQKINGYLFDIVQDILCVNFDIANDNIINANALNLLRNSLILDSFISQGIDNNNNNQINNMNNNQKILNPTNVTQNKFIKIISKKNLEIKNSFISPNNRSNTNSFIINNNNNNNIEKNVSENNNNIINNNNSIFSINKKKTQEIDKSLSKMQMLRNVLINNITKSEEIQQNMKNLKEYLNNVIYLNTNYFHKVILRSKNPTNLLSNLSQDKDDTSKEMINFISDEDTTGLKDINLLNRKTNLYTESASEIYNYGFIPNNYEKSRQLNTIHSKNNLSNNNNNNKSVRLKSNNSSSYFVQGNSFCLLTQKDNNSIRNKNQSTSSFNHSKSNANFRRNNEKYDFMSFKEKSSLEIKDVIEKYLQTGTATRKFDGVLVNYQNGEVRCQIAGGLAAEHKIGSIPLQDQLGQVKGDDDNTFFLSLAPNSFHFNNEIMLNNNK